MNQHLMNIGHVLAAQQVGIPVVNAALTGVSLGQTRFPQQAPLDNFDSYVPDYRNNPLPPRGRPIAPPPPIDEPAGAYLDPCEDSRWGGQPEPPRGDGGGSGGGDGDDGNYDGYPVEETYERKDRYADRRDTRGRDEPEWDDYTRGSSRGGGVDRGGRGGGEEYYDEYPARDDFPSPRDPYREPRDPPPRGDRYRDRSPRRRTPPSRDRERPPRDRSPYPPRRYDDYASRDYEEAYDGYSRGSRGTPSRVPREEAAREVSRDREMSRDRDYTRGSDDRPGRSRGGDYDRDRDRSRSERRSRDDRDRGGDSRGDDRDDRSYSRGRGSRHDEPPRGAVDNLLQPSPSIIAQNLPADCNEKEMEDIVMRAGYKPLSVALIRDKSGDVKGFGFVEFKCIRDAEGWLTYTKRQITVAGKTVNLNFAKPKVYDSHDLDWYCADCSTKNFHQRRRNYCMECGAERETERKSGGERDREERRRSDSRAEGEGTAEEHTNDTSYEYEPMKKISISGINKETKKDALRGYFQQFGEILDINLIRTYDPAKKLSKGVGFVTYTRSSAVEAVIKALPHVLDGKTLDIKRAAGPRGPRAGKPRVMDRGGNPPCNVIMIRGMDFSTSEETVRTVMTSLTDKSIFDVRLITDKSTDLSRGFCFVEMGTTEDATELLDKMLDRDDPFALDGRRVHIGFARHGFNNTTGKNSVDPKTAAYNAIEQAASNRAQEFHQQQQTQHDSGASTIAAQAQQYATAGHQGAAYAEHAQYAGQSQYAHTALTSAATVATAQAAAAQGYSGYSAPAAVSGYTYDATSGYYYDSSTGLYYDAGTGYYYNGQTQQFLYWNGTQYVAVNQDGTVAQVATVANQPQAATVAGPPTAPVADAAAGEKEDPNKVAGSVAKPTSKEAKKIAKDMERWAKKKNKQNEQRKIAVEKAQEELRSLEAHEDALRKKIMMETLKVGALKEVVELKEQTTRSMFVPDNDDQGSVLSMSAGTSGGRGRQAAAVASSVQDIQVEDDDDYIDEAKLVNKEKKACLLCKRGFPSVDVLLKHVNMSQLHRTNLELYKKGKAVKNS